ncbi:MAG: tRNA (adenosine(37)-N6)-dimethylallyltransferase MiaA, partial [Proteobacteria bacterium]|nr:tRNA (adenosine(37)-N6)-dimethylallyltransferase MiaA [Pseudomonadota bacterium]
MASAATSAPALLIGGPTASGKSLLALLLARRHDGVVINADSMQVYRDLAIMTARPDEEEMAQAPHRLFGFLDAAQPCSVALWLEAARAEADAAAAQGRLPILVGGTGLHLAASMEG